MFYKDSESNVEGNYMPSFKCVIELSNQDKATLLDIVKKRASPYEQSCKIVFCLLLTDEMKSI